MQYYLIIGVPKDSPIEQIHRPPAGMVIEQAHDPFASKRMGEYVTLYRLRACNEETKLFNSNDGPDETEARYNARRRKYEDRGWSLAKINRAIGNRGWELSDDPVGLYRETREYLVSLARATGIVGVLVRSYLNDLSESWSDSEPRPLTEYMTANELSEGKKQVQEYSLNWIRS